MRKLLTLLSAGFLAFAVLIFLPGINSADAAAFMKLGDIKGEASDHDHKDWIIIESMSSPLSEAAAASGKRQHKPFTITKSVDKSSPRLQRASTSGKVFPKVIIDVQSNYGGSRATYLKYELTNVIVSSYDVGGSTAGTSSAAGNRTVQTEMVSLSYSSIRLVKAKPARKKKK